MKKPKAKSQERPDQVVGVTPASAGIMAPKRMRFFAEERAAACSVVPALTGQAYTPGGALRGCAGLHDACVVPPSFSACALDGLVRKIHPRARPLSSRADPPASWGCATLRRGPSSLAQLLHPGTRGVRSRRLQPWRASVVERRRARAARRLMLRTPGPGLDGRPWSRPAFGPGGPRCLASRVGASRICQASVCFGPPR